MLIFFACFTTAYRLNTIPTFLIIARGGSPYKSYLYRLNSDFSVSNILLNRHSRPKIASWILPVIKCRITICFIPISHYKINKQIRMRPQKPVITKERRYRNETLATIMCYFVPDATKGCRSKVVCIH